MKKAQYVIFTARGRLFKTTRCSLMTLWMSLDGCCRLHLCTRWNGIRRTGTEIMFMDELIKVLLKLLWSESRGSRTRQLERYTLDSSPAELLLCLCCSWPHLLFSLRIVCGVMFYMVKTIILNTSECAESYVIVLTFGGWYETLAALCSNLLILEYHNKSWMTCVLLNGMQLVLKYIVWQRKCCIIVCCNKQSYLWSCHVRRLIK